MALIHNPVLGDAKGVWLVMLTEQGNGGIPKQETTVLLPEASFGLRVLSSPASVCVCVRVCVCQSVRQSLAYPSDSSGPVQARIAKFGPKV